MKTIHFSGAPGQAVPPKLKSIAREYIPLSSMTTAEKRQAFGLWLGIVYMHRDPPPGGVDKGVPIEEDPLTLLEFHTQYEAGDWRELGRGLTLEETWFVFELTSGQEFMCLISSAFEDQPKERIERKQILDTPEIVDAAIRRAGGDPLTQDDFAQP